MATTDQRGCYFREKIVRKVGNINRTLKISYDLQVTSFSTVFHLAHLGPYTTHIFLLQ